MGARALSPCRPALEHNPRAFTGQRPVPPAAIDPIRAIDAITAVWGAAYHVDIDRAGRWWALRRDGLPGVSGTGPDDLLGAIKADHATRPAVTR